MNIHMICLFTDTRPVVQLDPLCWYYSEFNKSLHLDTRNVERFILILFLIRIWLQSTLKYT
jgi:hypothetical protein